MKLTDKDVEKLERFLEKIGREVYPEPPSATHTQITRKSIEYMFGKYPFQPGAKILDVGCGQGVAMEIFAAGGHSPAGINLSAEDASACGQKGLDAQISDQSFLDFDDGAFDCVWCRHCLEHSIFPAFTLSELFRVLKNGGHMYVEVPAPDTCCGHQTNPNHYSVLGKSMWIELVRRTGFNLLEMLDINHNVPAGPDVYWAFIMQKP